MNKTGLLAINGIPGSGKTLESVNIAIKHYKSENRWYKYLIALIKKYIYDFVRKQKFIVSVYKKIKSIRDKIYSIKIIRIILKILNLFFKFVLLLFLITNISIYLKIIIVIYVFLLKKIVKGITDLDYDYFNSFPSKKINNVYSTFPIILDKQKNIKSQPITIYDLMNQYSFLPNSLIIIDEIQLFIDSDEYKDKKKSIMIAKIAKFLQAHRHFGIKQIIFTSQSPSRIFKKGRNIVIGYLKQYKIINIPFIPISIMKGIIYYDFEYYGRYIPKDREERKKLPFEYKKVTQVFNRNKIYSSYDSCYLSLYNYSKPLLNKGTWQDLKVDYEYLDNLFETNEL